MTDQKLFDLTGKVAIVTGSTKGIGRAMVEGLAGAGATVVVSSRKQDLCEQVAKEVEADDRCIDAFRHSPVTSATGTPIPGVRRHRSRPVRAHRRAREQRGHHPDAA